MNIKLIYLVSLKFYLKHYKKLLLTVFSISLGISLFLTVNSYKHTIEIYLKSKLSQFNTHQYIITSSQGNISFKQFKEISKSNLVKDITPFYETICHIKTKNKDLKTSTIIVTDLLKLNSVNSRSNSSEYQNLFSNSYSVLYESNQDYLNILKNETEYEIPILKIKNNINYIKNTILLDYVAFNHWFKEPFLCSYISLDIYNFELFKQKLNKISPSLSIKNKNEQVEDNQKITESFTKNLEFLSILSILISIFISYQFFYFIILDRQKQFNTMRALGMSSKKVILLLFSELIIITFITWLLSLILAFCFSYISLNAIEKTITEFFIPIQLEYYFFNPLLLIKTLLITLFSILLSSIHPILKIASKSIQYRNYYPLKINKNNYFKFALLGCVILIVSYAFSELNQFTYRGYVMLFGTTLFFLFQLPMILNLIIKILEKLMNEKYKIPIAYFKENIIHHSTLCFTFCLAMSLYLCLFIFIGSFRITVTDWINSVNWADYYIHHKQTTIQTPVAISPNITKKILNHPSIESYDILSRYDAFYKSERIKIIAGNFDFLKESTNRLKLKQQIKSSLNVFNDAIISETFSNKYNVTIGDKITLEGPFGSYDCVVKNIFFAYLNDQGYVYISDVLATKLFKSLPNHGLGIIINKNDKTFKLDLFDYLKDNNIFLDSFSELKESVITTFNNTFKITWMLAIISAFISCFTLINYISIFIIQFEKTFIQLKTLGASHKFIKHLLMWQNSIVVIISFIYSIFVSLSFSYILIVYINKPIFGWTIKLNVNPIAFVQVLILSYILLLITTHTLYNRKKKLIESTKLNYEI